MSGRGDLTTVKSPKWITIKRDRTIQSSTEPHDIIETCTITFNPVRALIPPTKRSPAVGPQRSLTTGRSSCKLVDFSDQKIKGRWRGLDKYDGKKRIYRSIPSYFPRKTRRQYRRGCLMTSFTRYKLLRIAWKLVVSNPEGFDKSDCEFVGLNDDEGFKHFVSGWNRTTKDDIISYIWNHLYDTNQIHCP